MDWSTYRLVFKILQWKDWFLTFKYFLQLHHVSYRQKINMTCLCVNNFELEYTISQYTHPRWSVHYLSKVLHMFIWVFRVSAAQNCSNWQFLNKTFRIRCFFMFPPMAVGNHKLVTIDINHLKTFLLTDDRIDTLLAHQKYIYTQCVHNAYALWML